MPIHPGPHPPMARRLFRKLMPEERFVSGNPFLRFFGATLLNKRLWHLNRHSAAIGAASGMFWAWICLPVQTVGAVLTAWFGRGNVPLAMAFTWVSNPLTWLPCFWLAYEVGCPLTPAERIDIQALIRPLMAGDWSTAGRTLLADLPQLYPMYVGGVVLGLFFGTMTYLVVSVLWRWHVGRRWRKRHHVASDRPRPLSRGIAALARLRNRGATT